MKLTPWFGWLTGALLWAFALAVPVSAEQPDEPAAASVSVDDEYELLKLFVETFHEIEQNYVKPVNHRELIEAAIDGMLTRLDQHSDYIPPAELEDFRRGVESEFAGIGVQLSMENGLLTIVSPIVDSPAYRAGLAAGDVITHIGGAPTRELTLAEAVKLLKGELGSEVELKIRRAEDQSEQTLSIRRDNVRIRTVLGDHRKADDSWEFMFDDEQHIGYVRITAFTRHTASELREALNGLTAGDMRGLLLDLRFNAGGLLSAAVEVSDLFIREGVIVTAAGRGVEQRAWLAQGPGTVPDFFLVVLVNRFSASASEIVAACLQDHGRAEIAGQRTWGKGSVQNVISLEEGRSALKLTTAEYRRPRGGNIHRHENDTEADEWGVKPDEGLELRLTDAEAARLDRLRRHKDLLSQRGAPAEPLPDQQLELALNHLRKKLAAGTDHAVAGAAAAQDGAAETAAER